MKWRRYYYLIIIVLSIVCYLFFINGHRNRRLIENGNRIVSKIEEFKNKNGRLPISLDEIGVIEGDYADAIYYLRQDSIGNYMLWFGTSLGESITYFSDRGDWESTYRKMLPRAPASVPGPDGR